MTKSDTSDLCARVAQLVEHDLAKVGVAGSSPVSRSCFAQKEDAEKSILFFVQAELKRALHSRKN